MRDRAAVLGERSDFFVAQLRAVHSDQVRVNNTELFQAGKRTLVRLLHAAFDFSSGLVQVQVNLHVVFVRHLNNALELRVVDGVRGVRAQRDLNARVIFVLFDELLGLQMLLVSRRQSIATRAFVK